MKKILFPILTLFIYGCSSHADEKLFYRVNAQILQDEYELKKQDYTNKILLLGHYNSVDSVEKIIDKLSHLESDDQKVNVVKDIEALFKHFHVDYAESMFEELKKCDYTETEKIEYYSTLARLSYINGTMQLELSARFSFDMAGAEYKILSKGDSLQIEAYIIGNNTTKPNYVVIGKDTFTDYNSCELFSTRLCFKYKNVPNDTDLANAEFFYYSPYFEKYKSLPLYKEDR